MSISHTWRKTDKLRILKTSLNDEFDFLLREVKKLKENGVSLTDICVVARTKKLVDDYIALFTRAGIRSYAIKRNKVDDRSFDGLRVATMHRVKGLEFKYVFIAAVNNRIIPMPSAINKTDVVSEAESITSEKCLLYVAMTRAQKVFILPAMEDLRSSLDSFVFLGRRRKNIC